MSAPKRIGAPEGGDVRSTGAPPPPLKIEREKRYVCGRCGLLFLIGNSTGAADWCRKCGRRFVQSNNNFRYLPLHPWAWQP